MKKYADMFKSYFNNKKRLTYGILTLLIGILYIGSSIVNHTIQQKKPTYRTISYDEEATASAQVAGISDKAQDATASPTLRAANQIFVTPTIFTQAQQPTTASKPTSPNAIGGSNTTTSTQQATATPVPATHTNPPVQNTQAPTSPPPTPEATPTPGFGISINPSSVEDDIFVEVNANRPLLFCKIQFRNNDNVPLGDYSPSAGGNNCSATHGKSEVKKIWVYVVSDSGEKKEESKDVSFE